jgi:hypothetical protein
MLDPALNRSILRIPYINPNPKLRLPLGSFFRFFFNSLVDIAQIIFYLRPVPISFKPSRYKLWLLPNMAINVKFLNGDIVVPNLAAKKAKKLRRS